MTALDRYPSLMLVVGSSLLWLVVALFAPDALAVIFRPPRTTSEIEGPIDFFQHVLLLGCLGMWGFIAWRLRQVWQTRGGSQLAWILAAVMVLQLGILIGEELDWGQVVSMRGDGWRNLRMVLRDAGIIPYFMDAPALTAWLIFFLLSPLVPNERLQAWWKQAEPVRANRWDALAILAIPVCFLAVWGLVGALSAELFQTSAYLVVVVVSARIVRDVRED